MLDVLGAVAAALLVFAAVPLVLVVVVGNPLSDGLGHTWASESRDALFVVALAAWLAWAACCVQLLRAVVAHVRSGDVRGHGVSILDDVAARIAVGVLALSSVGSVAVVASAGASLPSVQTSAPAPPTLPGTYAAPSPFGSPATKPEARSTYVVQRGDTLWRIAHDVLDDGADWTALAVINLGQDMGGGERFVDPDHIEAGWRLRLPDGANSSHGRMPRSGPRHSDESSKPGGGSRDTPDRLPELLALGLGSLGCAALARRARLRHRPERFRGDLDVGRTDSDGAVDASTLLGHFDGVPALDAFEAANCLLGRARGGAGEGTPSMPVVRAVHVGSRGVTFWLRGTHGDPPAGFTALADGAAWHVTSDQLEAFGATTPYVPIVFPVGDDEEGTWLVPLGAGDVLPLLGKEARSLARSMRTSSGAWAWADTVLVTPDAGDPEFLSEATADPHVARHLLFFGDPAELPPHVAARAAVVTTASVSASDLSVLVDRHGATIHPLGRVVRPHLQSEDAARNIAELFASDGPPLQTPTAVPSAVRSDAVRMSSDPPGSPEPNEPHEPMEPPTGITTISPGRVDVRLMTMTPRLEGLQEPLPANRARRAIELVAYLALHHPDVITSDRLRTRVLGSSDADAAAKTLFNTAHAARRAMGVDSSGAPLLPSATRTGLYQVSPGVTVDVLRAGALAAEAKMQEDPTLAIALYRAALELVEGEPLANALAGYAWWEAEGHGGRLATVLVDAACAMAGLASASGFFELARWGLDRARLVEPYSETLSRSAMEVAASEGDVERLRHEWRECQRRVDILDPGSSPSPHTESLFGELSRSLGAGPPRSGLRVPHLVPAPSVYAPAANEGTPSAAP